MLEKYKLPKFLPNSKDINLPNPLIFSATCTLYSALFVLSIDIHRFIVQTYCTKRLDIKGRVKGLETT